MAQKGGWNARRSVQLLSRKVNMTIVGTTINCLRFAMGPAHAGAGCAAVPYSASYVVE